MNVNILNDVLGRTAENNELDKKSLEDFYRDIYMLLPSPIQKSPDKALLAAARQGYVLIVDLLLGNANIDLNELVGGTTALHEAVKQGHIIIVKRLLEKRARIDVQDSSGKIPFHLALDEMHLKIAQLLLENDKRDIKYILPNFSYSRPQLEELFHLLIVLPDCMNKEIA